MSFAEKYLADYKAISDKEAAGFALDLGLMSGIEEGGKLLFKQNAPYVPAPLCPGSPLSDTVLDTLYQAAGLKDGLTRIHAARLMMDAFLAADGSGALPKLYYKKPVAPQSGDLVLDNALIFADSASGVENGGDSVLTVKNSVVKGVTTGETKPLSGPPGGLLVSGNMRTTLAVKQAQAHYVNSKLSVPNWAVFSTDAAEPAGKPGEKELGVWAYGSEGTAEFGGYGVYSDLFCNAYFYGSAITVPEIGAISGTFGTLTFGSIADGEQDPALVSYLTEADKAKNPDKGRPAVIKAGRNAVMIHCVSLPPYWGRPGYSQTELPLHAGVVTVKNAVLETDLSLDKHIAYPEGSAQYIAHHAGSVIFVKSCNTELLVERSVLKPAEGGTGAVLHTAVNSDIAFSVKVPDGTSYPGVRAGFRDMALEGDILHEDYQRDLYLTLTDVRFTGKLVTGTVDTWNETARREGFEACIIDPQGYRTVHGSHVILAGKTTWQVIGESRLNTLVIGDEAAVTGGVITVDGVQTAAKPGAYSGSIVIRPE